MNYPETIQFLYGLRVFGARLGLDTTRKLAARAGHPEKRLRFIHVAGTNGKGSTCAMLESIYRAAGCRVGLFTSPHLVSFRERIQVNRQMISEADVVRRVTAVREWSHDFPADQQPTLFEVVTVMALGHFAEAECDLVIWETGLGGRLDATNIVIPLASVITNISLDHQQWLGNTLAEIAAEKAGIIKSGVPVITGAEGDALAVIERVAREKQSPLKMVHRDEVLRRPEEDTAGGHLALAGDHQRLNAALAMATVDTLQPQFPVSSTIVRKGLEHFNWPGRLQLLSRDNGRKILLDGAHNIDGINTLKAALKKLFPGERPTLVLGILADKDWAAMCEKLAPLASRIITVPVNSARTAAPEELAGICRKKNPAITLHASPSLTTALTEVADDKFVVIAGSLYLVGEALELLQAGETGGWSERKLNEWNSIQKSS